MKLRQRTNNFSKLQILVGAAIFLLTTAVSAQAPPPPPPAPPADSAPAAALAADAKAPEAGGIDPMVEREIIDHIVNGKTAVKALDLTTAQMYFEQAFAKCDAAQVKGPLLARVYMALGSLYAGFLQQVPQGTEFIKMALTNDTNAKPEEELSNETVQNTYDMVRERLGITGPAQVDQGGGAVGPGGFWVMKHERVTEAKRMFPFGVFIETNPMVAVQAVRLYFRLPSDRNYQGANMQKNGSMYGILIGCDAIALLDPQAIYYYIEVIGGDGSVIAHEGTLDSPIEIKMIDEGSFTGTQPVLPGMEEQQKCNPDDAAPCPPWDPHCHDMPCVTTEDCLGGKVCREGYCQGGSGDGGEGYEDDSEIGALGISVYFGMGLGFGIVGGDDEDPIDEDDPNGNPIPLASGMSPSWMFTRFGIGYFFTDFIRAGLWMRLQHIKSQTMKVAGPSNDENSLFPMWGISGTLFYWGKGEWFANGQVVDEDGKLADDQGLRLYAKLEFNFNGAMYHELTLSGKDTTGETQTIERDHASGMQALGIGPGILYGLHKNFDIGFEVMYDYVGIGTGTWAHNFDAWLQLHVHF